jgi:hypothetical protein
VAVLDALAGRDAGSLLVGVLEGVQGLRSAGRTT